MATTTSGNLGLSKPEYTDVADIAVLNGNSDKTDASVSGMENGLTIYSNNNTHAAITTGQYVYVRNHGTLAEGLYKATADVAQDASLTSSNMTPVSGALNTLAANIATNASNITNLSNDIANHGVTVLTDSVTIPAGNVRAELNKSFAGAQDYYWIAIQEPNSSSDAYDGILIDFVYASTSSNIKVSVNRQLRNDTSSAITCRIVMFGVKKPS